MDIGNGPLEERNEEGRIVVPVVRIAGSSKTYVNVSRLVELCNV